MLLGDVAIGGTRMKRYRVMYRATENAETETARTEQVYAV